MLHCASQVSVGGVWTLGVTMPPQDTAPQRAAKGSTALLEVSGEKKIKQQKKNKQTLKTSPLALQLASLDANWNIALLQIKFLSSLTYGVQK